jgi:uncharacterized protein (TIGR02246 family)
MERNAFARMQPSPAKDAEQAIIRIMHAWADAWNAHDMEQARALVAAEIEFVTVAGLWLKGGAEFLAHHRAIHRMQMRESEWTNLQYELRFIREDLCLVHLEWMVAGDRNPDGTPRERRYGLFTWLTERRGEGWLIIAVHNSDLRLDLRHRLSRVGSTTPGAFP